MTCPKCGQINQVGSSFCTHCGNPLEVQHGQQTLMSSRLGQDGPGEGISSRFLLSAVALGIVVSVGVPVGMEFVFLVLLGLQVPDALLTALGGATLGGFLVARKVAHYALKRHAVTVGLIGGMVLVAIEGIVDGFGSLDPWGVVALPLMMSAFVFVGGWLGQRLHPQSTPANPSNGENPGIKNDG